VTDDFTRHVVRPVRDHLGPGVRPPSVGAWDLGTDRGEPVLTLDLPTSALEENLQTDEAASPYFLLCFAFWHARLTGRDPRLRVTVSGEPSADASAVRHARRARIGLEALCAALGDRLDLRGVPSDPWPPAPVLNAPRVERSHEEGRGGREHQVEAQLAREPLHADAFPPGRDGSPISAFHRQLPLGLFDRKVSRATAWTPGGAAQADLWATSPDGEVFHLFELKVAGNEKVGIVPELLTYAWIVHRARHGLPDGRRVRGDGPGLQAARRAERLVAWTLAPALHRLVASHGQTPLAWLAEGLRGRIELGMLSYVDVGSPGGFGGWRPAETWRSWS
jgi:hypothetical protein